MSKLNKVLISCAVLAVSGGAVFLGAGSAVTTMQGCSAMVSRYTLAHFSEEYPCTQVGADGEVYMDICENTWTKYASHTTTTPTINGRGRGAFTKDGYYFSHYPKITKDFTMHPHFEGYTQEHDVVIKREYSDGDYLRTNDHLQCLIDIGSTVTVRTLYGYKLWEM